MVQAGNDLFLAEEKRRKKQERKGKKKKKRKQVFGRCSTALPVMCSWGQIFLLTVPVIFLVPLVLPHLFTMVIYYWQGFPHIQVMLWRASLLHCGILSPMMSYHSPCSQAALLVLHGFLPYRTGQQGKSFPKLLLRDKTAGQWDFQCLLNCKEAFSDSWLDRKYVSTIFVLLQVVENL